MKWLSLLLLTSLFSGILAWSAQDREIFSLQESVETDLGKHVTFYDWLGVDRNADHDAIGKAYKKLSVKLHPDKDSSKKATERFSRLGLVYKILRGPGRERYDFFLDHGFPRWNGTDYYYSRYRPGFGTVLVFLYLLVGVAQYAFLRITAHQHRKHMSQVIDKALELAGVTNTQRKVSFENGKVFMVYPHGAVSLIDDDVEYLLSVEDIKLPTWEDTIVYKVPFWGYCKVTGRQYSSLPEKKDTSVPVNEKEKKPKPKPAAKVGAVRRKK